MTAQIIYLAARRPPPTVLELNPFWLWWNWWLTGPGVVVEFRRGK